MQRSKVLSLAVAEHEASASASVTLPCTLQQWRSWQRQEYRQQLDDVERLLGVIKVRCAPKCCSACCAVLSALGLLPGPRTPHWGGGRRCFVSVSCRQVPARPETAHRRPRCTVGVLSRSQRMFGPHSNRTPSMRSSSAKTISMGSFIPVAPTADAIVQLAHFLQADDLPAWGAAFCIGIPEPGLLLESLDIVPAAAGGAAAEPTQADEAETAKTADHEPSTAARDDVEKESTGAVSARLCLPWAMHATAQGHVPLGVSAMPCACLVPR